MTITLDWEVVSLALQGQTSVTERVGLWKEPWRLLVRHRRLSIDYEALPATEDAFIYAAMVRVMLRRLA